MIELLLDTANFPFTIALGLMLVIAFLEGICALLGAGVSSALHQFLPEMDVDGAFEMPDVAHPTALGRILSWIHVGRLPVLVVLVLFLMCFGLVGLLVQDLARQLTGGFIPAFVASAIAFLATLPVVRCSVKGLSRIIPADESMAVSRTSFIGQVAKVTLGTAKRGTPTQAKLKDRFGKTHYILMEPDEEHGCFSQGDKVLIVKHDGAKFYGIKAPQEILGE